ncbi:MAG TPA: formate dehydrogenase [Gemmatimonas aurantiaca]|uniref:Formate dehydrogenase n=2 Tax=Gemmatimonas aurantiaca TaxID=173480 RepID=A0A3D4V5I0_9BACT|nr:NAD(P)H-dependent oxidoreductase subunit E [Gemmatimonas aurantiaca]BAH39425.1 putative formate dehydrogenase gamma subunit [Gemmatimonas aurantiaca T-27]HCT56054.1 formate dehydrogenase [Gemmatimonas aurantiaca]
MSRDAIREQAVIADLLAQSPTGAEHLLPVLQQVQATVGFVSQDAMRQIAQAFNISRADVYGVVTFYTDLREAPVGQYVMQLCMAEACQSVGCRELAAHATHVLGVPLGQTTADHRIHLEAAYCFGNCALGPTMRIDDRIVGGVTPARFDELLAELPVAASSERGAA